MCNYKKNKVYLLLLGIWGFLNGAAEPQSAPAAPVQMQWRTIREASDSSHRINWHLRQEMRKEARLVYDQIVSIVGLVENVLSIFGDKLKEIQGHIDAFYVGMGGSKDNAQRTVQINKRLAAELAQVQKQIAAVKKLKEGSEESGVKKLLAEYEIEVENAKLWSQDVLRNVKLLESAQNTLQEAIAVLNEENAKVHGYEQEAWKNYQQLDELITDAQANALVKNIQAHLKNSENIKQYIYTQYLEFFNQLVQRIVGATQSISGESKKLHQKIEALKTVMQNEIAKEEQIQKALAEERTAKQAKEAAEAKRIAALKEAELARQKRPWYIKIRDGIYSYASLIVSSMQGWYHTVVHMVKSLFGMREAPHKSFKRHARSMDEHADTAPVEEKALVPQAAQELPGQVDGAVPDKPDLAVLASETKQEVPAATQILTPKAAPQIALGENPYAAVGQVQPQAMTEQVQAQMVDQGQAVEATEVMQAREARGGEQEPEQQERQWTGPRAPEGASRSESSTEKAASDLGLADALQQSREAPGASRLSGLARPVRQAAQAPQSSTPRGGGGGGRGGQANVEAEDTEGADESAEMMPSQVPVEPAVQSAGQQAALSKTKKKTKAAAAQAGSSSSQSQSTQPSKKTISQSTEQKILEKVLQDEERQAGQ